MKNICLWLAVYMGDLSGLRSEDLKGHYLHYNELMKEILSLVVMVLVLSTIVNQEETGLGTT